MPLTLVKEVSRLYITVKKNESGLLLANTPMTSNVDYQRLTIILIGLNCHFSDFHSLNFWKSYGAYLIADFLVKKRSFMCNARSLILTKTRSCKPKI